MITKRNALALAKKKLGDSAFVRQDTRTHFDGLPLPRSDAERAAYRAQYMDMKATEPKWKPLEQWDASTPLGEYRDALTAYNTKKAAWRKLSESVRGLSYYYAFSVGTTHDIFTETKGKGDDWESALRAAGVEPL
jgi:hypothetical protein